IIINLKEYRDLYGYDGLFYKTGNTKSKATKNGFYVSEVVCHKKTILYPDGTIINQLYINLINGTLTGFINGHGTVAHLFKVKIHIRANSIPSKFLKMALDEKHI